MGEMAVSEQTPLFPFRRSSCPSSLCICKRSLYDDGSRDERKKTSQLITNTWLLQKALFTDEVFNIGSDETSAKGRCSVNTSFAIERRLLQAIQTDFKKTPAVRQTRLLRHFDTY
jgi:hypothetical protein